MTVSRVSVCMCLSVGLCVIENVCCGFLLMIYSDWKIYSFMSLEWLENRVVKMCSNTCCFLNENLYLASNCSSYV